MLNCIRARLLRMFAVFGNKLCNGVTLLLTPTGVDADRDRTEPAADINDTSEISGAVFCFSFSVLAVLSVP